MTDDQGGVPSLEERRRLIAKEHGLTIDEVIAGEEDGLRQLAQLLLERKRRKTLAKTRLSGALHPMELTEAPHLRSTWGCFYA